MGSDFSCTLVVHRGAGAYICGEETALLDSLEGKRGNPRLKPPFPANQGLFQGPTLINNVETLCNAPHIIVNGAEWYRKHGTEQSPGTKVVSVSGNVQSPGNYEIELGIPAREIVYGLAGGPPDGKRVKAWFPGGSSAPVLTEADLDLPYDFEHMAEAGSMLGSGAIIVVDESVPIVDVALRLAEFYRHESCGKCVPCREGTNWTVKMLERIDRGEATPIDLDVMASVQKNIIGHCLCVLGDAMAMPIGQHDRQVPAGVRKTHRKTGDGGGRGVSKPPPEKDWISFTIDGIEARAPDGEWLVDAAKRNDVEIPFFCYEKEARRSGRRLPHVPGRDRRNSQTSNLLLDAGQGRHGRLYPNDRVKESQKRDRRIPARQPPARLPGLRQGRRMSAAGHLLRLGARPQPPGR